MEKHTTDDFSSLIESISSKYVTDDIFVVGKGASIDAIDLKAIGQGLIININDSEVLLPGEICLFHKPWVLESIRRNGFKCKLYLSDLRLQESTDVSFFHLPFVPFTHETSDLLIYRFVEEDIQLEEMLFVTAAKICRVIASKKNKAQNVYMLGFDFGAGPETYSKHLLVDYSKDDAIYKSAFIKSQEYYFIELLNLCAEEKAQNLKIIHVGKKPYSKMSSDQFNQTFRHKTLATGVGVAGKSLPPDHVVKQVTRASADRVLVVAEFTNNHLGDIKRLREMVRLAKDAGADLIKVQKRDVDTFYTDAQLNSYYDSPFGKTLGDYRRGVELTIHGFEALDDECRKRNIGWFSSVLDFPSYLFLEKFARPILKIPSTVSEDRELHGAVARRHKGTLVISTGFTSSDYEQYILNVFEANEKIYFLQTTSAYPTPPYECGIALIRHYRDLTATEKKIIPGYSSHDLGSLGSMLAVAAGAKMIEKHVKLGDTKWIHFDDVALDLSTGSFGNFVKDVRLAEQMCGDESKHIQASEHHKYFAKLN